MKSKLFIVKPKRRADKKKAKILEWMLNSTYFLSKDGIWVLNKKYPKGHLLHKIITEDN